MTKSTSSVRIRLLLALLLETNSLRKVHLKPPTSSISKLAVFSSPTSSQDTRIGHFNKLNPLDNDAKIFATILTSIVISQTPLMTLAINTFILAPIITVTNTFDSSKPRNIQFLDVISEARPEGVNRPDLLPQDKSQVFPVIDVANFLSKGQEKRAIAAINTLEKNTGFKLRLLCQRNGQ